MKQHGEGALVECNEGGRFSSLQREDTVGTWALWQSTVWLLCGLPGARTGNPTLVRAGGSFMVAP